MTVVFVGDRPSRLNTDPEVAFIGTPSFTNLCKWIVKMQIPDFVTLNSWTHADKVGICIYYNMGLYAFVALGNEASNRLAKMDIAHFKLPHPSPRNRKLNNKKLIDSELKKCYLYIKEQNRKCASFVPNGKKVS